MEESLTYLIRYDEINNIFLAYMAHEPTFQAHAATAPEALAELLYAVETYNSWGKE